MSTIIQQEDLDSKKGDLPSPASSKLTDNEPIQPLLKSLLASEEVDMYEIPADMQWISPEELDAEKPYHWQPTNQNLFASTLRKRKIKLINNYSPEPDEQNPWYLRFLHGAKSGSLIGAAGGALFSPAAPVVSTAVGTLIGAGTGGIIGVVGGWIPAFTKRFLPRVYEFFYPPYTEVELNITDEEEALLHASKIAYREANNLKTRPEFILEKQKELTKNDEAARREAYDEASKKLKYGIVVRYLYPQKPLKLSRPSTFFKWDINTLMGALGGVTVGAAIGTLIGGPIGAAIGGVVGGAVGIIAANVTNHIAQRSTPNIVVTRLKKEGTTRSIDDESERPSADLSLETAPKFSPGHMPTIPKSDPSWFEESQADVPWFVRIACGSGGGAVLGGAIGSVVPIIGTAIGAAAGAVIGGAAGYVSPFVFALGRSLVNSFKKLVTDPNTKYAKLENAQPDLRDDQNWPEFFKEDPFHLPWYVRVMPGATAGAAIGAAVGTAIFPALGTVLGGLIGAAAGTGLAWASPFIMATFRKSVRTISNIFDSKPKNAVTNSQNTHAPDGIPVPWYFRLLAGVTAGAAIGGLVGSVAPGIGNALGAAVGTLIGAGAVYVAPLVFDSAKYVWLKITDKIFGPCASKQDGEKVGNKPGPIVPPWHIRAMAGAMAGSILGGAIGAIPGSTIPGLGTLAGAAAGAALGGTIGAAIYVFVPMVVDFISWLRAPKPTDVLQLDTLETVNDSDKDLNLSQRKAERKEKAPTVTDTPDAATMQFNPGTEEQKLKASAGALHRQGSFSGPRPAPKGQPTGNDLTRVGISVAASATHTPF